MDTSEKKKLFTPEMKRNLFRLFLRNIPIIPGPELYDIIEDLKKSRSSIDAKINQAYDSLKETSSLIHQLESELNERTEKVTKLRDEYKRYSELAALEEEKAESIIKQLEISLGKGKNAERWISFIINIIAGIILFIFGICAGPYLTKLLGITSQ